MPGEQQPEQPIEDNVVDMHVLRRSHSAAELEKIEESKRHHPSNTGELPITRKHDDEPE